MGSGFWTGKKVFITGHTGFKGAWLSLWMHWLGARVMGYALRPPSEPSLFELCGMEDFIAPAERDVRDFPLLHAAIDEACPEIVFHLAAQSLVRRSYEAPLETYATNVMGTANLLEVVRRCPSVKVVIVVTSDKCYENREWVWGYREDDPMGGFDPYSSSKGCAELVTAAFRRSFLGEASRAGGPVAVASVRAGNVIGGGDWAKDRLIPDILAAFGSKRPALIRNPAAVRPWQHVLEPLSGYLTLAENLWGRGDVHAGAWNFGPAEDDVKPVSWVIERLAAIWGDNAGWRVDGAPQPHEAGYLKLDCSKARMRLGWAPRLDLNTALEWVVEWHRAYLSGKNVRETTMSQIQRYHSLR